MRAHKLSLQALWRILVPTFLSYVDDAVNDNHNELSTLIADNKSERIPELVSLVMQQKYRKLLGLH